MVSLFFVPLLSSCTFTLNDVLYTTARNSIAYFL